MYDASRKLLNEIESMLVNSLACIRVTGGKASVSELIMV